MRISGPWQTDSSSDLIRFEPRVITDGHPRRVKTVPYRSICQIVGFICDVAFRHVAVR
jgi:hypothetical protein